MKHILRFIVGFVILSIMLSPIILDITGVIEFETAFAIMMWEAGLLFIFACYTLGMSILEELDE